MLTVGYATFTITMHIPWIGALIGFAVFGIALRPADEHGRRLGRHRHRPVRLAVFIEVLIWLGGLLLG